MPDIKDSVGEGGANKVHDVALVEAMLRIVKNAKNQPYFNANYDGKYGTSTKTAITAFQNDYKLVPPPGKEEAGKDKLGFVTTNGATIQKLNALLPETHQKLWVIENTTTVYLEGDSADMTTSKTAISNDPNLETGFRKNVSQLVESMFNNHKIVLWLTPTGSRRTFAQQAKEVNTKAGPGESNHNFGRAVDIGFKGLKWLKGDTTIVQDSHWLNKLEANSTAKTNAFWDARDALALKPPLNLYRLQMERIHLQAFDQSMVSMSKSLAQLLTQVGTMQWKPRYQSDLGSKGKTFFNVGTAKQIWAGNAIVTKNMIAKVKGIKSSEVKNQDIMAMRKALKGDFQSADINWQQWKPISN